MFSEKRKIRYSHLSPSGAVRMSEILRFVQDAAVMHTAHCGYPIDKLYKERSAWILLSIHLVEVKTVLCSEITVKTWPYDFSKVFGPRAFLICDADTDEVLIKGSALWTFVDTETGRPKPIPSEMIDNFGTEDKACDVPFIRRLPNHLTACSALTYSVLKRDLDTNGHMNNVKYLEYAEEVLPDTFSFTEIEIFYKQPLFLGNSFSISMKELDDDSYVVNIKNSNDEICTYIRFIR